MTLQIGTRGNPGAKILIVGEAWGATEERQGLPFVGESGKLLDQLLKEGGVDPADCYYSNVINARPAGNNMTQFFIPTKVARDRKLPSVRGLYPGIKILEGIEALEDLINKLQPKLIIGFGNYALWALTENCFKVADGKGPQVGYKIPAGIAAYRGSQLRSRFNNIPYLPTYHPAFILRDWTARPTTVHDLRARVPLYKDKWDEPTRNYIINPSFGQAMECLTKLRLRAELASAPILVATDIENLGQFIECVGLAWSRTDAICIPIMSSTNQEGYWPADEEVAILMELRRVLAHPNIEHVGQYFIHDYQHFYRWLGVHTNWKHDTMLAHHVCFPGTPAGLSYISSMYCDYHAYWKEDGKEAAKEHNDLQRWVYNCRDVVTTYEAIEELWKIIKIYGLELQYSIQMVRALSATKQMMLRGVKIDHKRKAVESEKYLDRLMEMGAELESCMPEEIWPRVKKASPWYTSPKQMGQIFYDTLGIPEVLDPDTHNRSVKDSALRVIMLREPLTTGLITRIQKYNSQEAFGQFMTMTVDSDSRMRCNYIPTTETFRYRSGKSSFGTGRNLQNIPKGTEED